jgi:uncharacterized protein with ATP-grasp and redox domains
MPELIKTYWRDIPSQVTAKAGRKTAKCMLPARFQEAIDRAAMRAGKGSSDAYMEDWRRDRSPCSAELQTVVDKAVAELAGDFDDTYLEALVKAKGIAANVKPELRPASAGAPDEPTAASDNASSDNETS